VRGLGAFQMAQMKHRDARIYALCQHLRSAIDILEQIATVPYQAPEKETPPPPAPPAAPVVIELPPEKLAYTIKEAKATLGIGMTTLYQLIADGSLTAVKSGSRTLILADTLRAWLASLPPVKRAGRSKSGTN